MRVRQWAAGAAACIGLCGSWACSADTGAPQAGGPQGATAIKAPGLAWSVGKRFGLTDQWTSTREKAQFEATPRGVALRATRTGTLLASLPNYGDAAVRIRDDRHDLEVRFALVGARSSVLSVQDGLAVFKDALGDGAHMVLAPSEEGLEDHVLLPKKDHGEGLQYRLELGSAAGLRLLENTLEFLDPSGAPRVRVLPPKVRDRFGALHAASLEVRGCRVDTSAAPPYARPVTDPGSRACTLSVRFDLPAALYPVLVDPAWQLTGSMKAKRREHAVAMLSSGVVLVTGGSENNIGSGRLSSAEYYSKGAFSTAPSMVDARAAHTLTELDNVVLAASGQGNGKFQLEYLDVKEPSPAWVGLAAKVRLGHAAATYEGEIWLCGGQDPLSTSVLGDCEGFDPLTKKLALRPSLKVPRMSLSLVPHPTELYAIGGTTGGLAGALNTVESLGVVVKGSWAPRENMLVGRANARAWAYSPSNIVVSGGVGPGGAWNSIETWCPFCKSAFNWVAAGTMAQSRTSHVMAGLSDGSALLAGGGSTVVELWRKGKVYPLSPMSVPRQQLAGLTLVTGDEVLATGGYSNGVLDSAEVWKRGDAGDPCSTAGDCKSEICAEGVCCDVACDKTCESCLKVSTGVADGTCAPKLAGQADSGCVDKGPGACSSNGLCDGKGSCDLYPIGTVCLPPICSNSATAFWQECTGPGACTDQKQEACGSFGCNGGVCATACKDSSECAKTGYCNQGNCAPKLANGKACNQAEECESNVCADGVCCNAACAGQCEACNEPGSEGTCVPVSGQPRAGKTTCEAATSPDAPCTARRCDGIVRESCIGYAPPTQVCAEAACSAGLQTFEAKCDGKGSCEASQTKECAPYVCDGAACKSDCSSDDDCAAGASCNGGKCVSGATCDGDHTVTGTDGKLQDCAPYKCNADGTCRAQCNSLDDCVGGSLCDENKQCVAVSADGSETDDSGCGCRLPGGGQKAPPVGALLALLGLVALSRRRPWRARRNA